MLRKTLKSGVITLNRQQYFLEGKCNLIANTLCCRCASDLSSEKLFYSEFGDPLKVVKMEALNISKVKDEQIVVKMMAAPVNPADINTIQGTYAIKPETFPAVPGNEGVGIIVKVGAGPNILSLTEGQWVIASTPCLGTWQGYLLGWNQDFLPVPEMDLICASTLAVNPPTAFRMLKDFEFLKPGETVIQNGGNSAVGQMVIQLCREFGLKSISIVRNRDNVEELKSKLIGLGDSNTVVLTEDEFRSNSKGIEAQLALNCVGGKSATDILRVLGAGRTMVTYGGMSRQPLTIPASSLIFNNIRLRGFWITRWNQMHNAESRLAMINHLAELFKQGKLKPPDTKLVPLAQYKEALENSMKGFVGTKYILTF